MSSRAGFRTERDSLGEVEVPSAALFGASTQRAVHNFPISGLRFGRPFVRALGLIKRCAAEANWELGLLPGEDAEAIIEAAAEVARGDHDSQFVVDIFQTGSGTSTNMNANEVIANRAGEILGAAYGARRIHPNDQVNLGQSSNDVIPSAIHVASLLLAHEELYPALAEVEQVLRDKAELFWEVIKTGRTHLQDATPIRLGQQMLGYAGQVSRAAARLRQAAHGLAELALGGTAVGTGINCHPDLAKSVCSKLSALTSLPLAETDNHFQAQSNVDALTAVSSGLRGVALALHKVASDVSWLGSGPRAGFGELELPPVQPGSSIMPGKVNPVIPEALIQVCAQVVGNDATVAFAAHRSIFELNMAWPVVGFNILQSIALLASATRVFSSKCLRDLRATKRGPALVEDGLGLATGLVPAIGYDAAAKIAHEAAASGRTVREVARECTQLDEAQLATLLDAAALT